MVWIWAVAFVLTLLIEIFTVELVSLWFSVGALVAFILALCGVNTTIQIVVFIVVSIVLTISLRWVFMKLLKNTKGKTNLDTVIGSVHTLIKPITDEEAGEIKVNGVIWSAISNGESIEQGKKVSILAVSGNRFIVKEVEQPADSKK